ncbi:MAG TPA: glycosyltransferase family 4 protein [Anaerolineales bacterium]|nr:glycosyltransferase family 4 protein [Anaerolineales bacterium]
MKITLLHYSSPPVVGGVESVLAHHARLMADAGHHVTILAGRGDVFDERVRVHILPHLDSRHPKVMEVKKILDAGKHTPDFDELRETIKKELWRELEDCDVIIAHNVASLHKNLALTAALHEAYKTPGFPRLILWHHDLAWTTPRYREELYNGYPWNLLCTPWEKVKHVVVSELRRRELAQLLSMAEDSIRVIPNGVDLKAFFKLEPQTVELIERLSLLEADPLLLLPVRLTPRKNIELALQVTAALRKEYPNVMLLVTGPEGPHNPNNKTYKEKLLRLREELGLQGTVHFLAEVTSEFMPDAVIADFYRLSDALLFPSQEEGFGIPLIEAAFDRTPVFCADIPVLRELGGEDVTYFVPGEDAARMAHQVKVRLEAELTSRWARRARRSYTWEHIYNGRIAPLLEEVMA